MKKLLSLTAISVAVMLVALPLAYGQGQEKGQEKGPGQAPAQAEKTFEGQLTKVDANAKTISVKGSAGEMLFRYTDQTQVLGPDKDIQGLATKAGTPLKITYREAANDSHLATRIEVTEQKR